MKTEDFYKFIYERVLNTDGIRELMQPVGKKKDGAQEFKYTKIRGGKCSSLMSIFGISGEDQKSFKEHFTTAAYGKGNEYIRINRLNSSSLLALLCFWKVSEEKPFKYKDIEYTSAIFEQENPVFGSNSSVDILLVSRDKKNLLFLESKFTEPLSVTKNYQIKPEYHLLYKTLLSHVFKVSNVYPHEIKHRDGTITYSDEFDISIEDNNMHYYGGIKQMISHLIGIIKSKDYKNVDNIQLSSILFDFKIGIEEYNYPKFHTDFFTTNRELPRQIRKMLHEDGPEIEVIAKPLIYQEVFSNESSKRLLTAKVKKFYRF